jgi:hypothetical protein
MLSEMIWKSSRILLKFLSILEADSDKRRRPPMQAEASATTRQHPPTSTTDNIISRFGFGCLEARVKHKYSKDSE